MCKIVQLGTISQSYRVNFETESAKFIYGSSGDVQGFIYNDVTYLYVKNLQGDILGVNLFAYCENNPIMFVDYSGFIPLLIYGLAVIIIIVVAVVAYTYIKQQVEKYYKRLNRALPNMNRIKYKIL